MYKPLFILLSFIYLNSSNLVSQIISGPMLGYRGSQEVGIWIEAQEGVDVSLLVADLVDSFTNHYLAKAKNGGVHHFYIDQLLPGKTYRYKVLINGVAQQNKTLEFSTQPVWLYRNDAPDFDFLIGSCFYINEPYYDRPGEPYGGTYQILESMKNEGGEFMLWLGDNTYLREADWDSKSGVFHRYQHTRAVPQLQPLLSAMHHYAIWDDHDYGPNDSDYSYIGKNWTREAFDTYWLNSVTPHPHDGGTTNYFTWYDCAFFLLDNRWDRDLPGDQNSLLGPAQRQWLIDALKASKHRYNFIAIGSQFLNTAKVFENYSNYADEREEILKAIEKNDINNVIFLTGDRHHSELSTFRPKENIVVHDITSSPITSGAHGHPDEDNQNRVPRSHYGERSFAKVKVFGPGDQRQIQVTFFDIKGKPVFQKILEF